MIKRSKNLPWLLSVLAVTVAGSCLMIRAANAVNPAFGANGIVWTRLATDVCPGSGATCTRANSGGEMLTKIGTNTAYVVSASPSPVPGQCLRYAASSGGIWTPGSCGGGGGGDTLSTAYSNGASNADETIGITSALGAVNIQDNATPITGDDLFRVSDFGDVNWSFTVDGTGLGVNGHPDVSLYDGVSIGASNINAGLVSLSNAVEATGGVPDQWSPLIHMRANSWDGSSSVHMRGFLGVETSNSATPTETLWLSDSIGNLGVAHTHILGAYWDGTNARVLVPGGTIGTDDTHQNTLQAVNGDTFVYKATTDTLTNKTATAIVLSGGDSCSGSSAYDCSGSTGTWKPPTGGLNTPLDFVGDGSVATSGESAAGHATIRYSTGLGAMAVSIAGAAYAELVQSYSTAGFTTGHVPFARSPTQMDDSNISASTSGGGSVSMVVTDSAENFTVADAGGRAITMYFDSTHTQLGSHSNTNLDVYTHSQSAQCSFTTDGGLEFYNITTPAVSSSNASRLSESSSHVLQLSNNTGALSPVVSEAATETLTNKTLTTPAINGATSASGNFDLSGSSGTTKTTTGTGTLSGDTSMASGKNFTVNEGRMLFSGSSPTVTLQTAAGTTGSVTTALSGSDNAFSVGITPGGTGVANGVWANINLAGTWSHTPVCSVSLGGHPDFGGGGAWTLYQDYANSSSSIVKIGIDYATGLGTTAVVFNAVCF